MKYDSTLIKAYKYCLMYRDMDMILPMAMLYDNQFATHPEMKWWDGDVLIKVKPDKDCFSGWKITIFVDRNLVYLNHWVNVTPEIKEFVCNKVKQLDNTFVKMNDKLKLKKEYKKYMKKQKEMKK